MSPDSPHMVYGSVGGPAGGTASNPVGGPDKDPGVSAEQQVVYLSHLVQIQHRLRQAKTPKELACILVNDTLQLLPYRQAIFWESTGGNICIKTISGTDQVDTHAPYLLFLKNLICSLGREPAKGPLSAKKVKENQAAEWEAWLPETLLVCPLAPMDTTGGTLGGLIFMRTDPWSPWEEAMLEQVAHTFAHALQALNKPRFLPWIARRVKNPLRLVLAGVILLALCLPIRLSVLAPMEIIPKDPVVIAAPMDGIVKQFMVTPNQPVTKEQPLFALDDIRLRNEYDISLKTLAVSRAEELRARQKAFGDENSRAELLVIKARIRQQEASVAYLVEKLERAQVLAPVPGIVVFNDINDFLGKPVVVGEKIVILADPGQVAVQIQLPVADAINLIPGAPIRIFLNIAPETPMDGSLHQTAYEAQVTPDGILAFRLKALLDPHAPPPRIGLRGTAKIYGEKVSLFYFLLRRPMAFVRQFLGL
jgi:HlyD family secretion protein